MTIQTMHDLIEQLQIQQQTICNTLEQFEPNNKKFVADQWQSSMGTGCTMVITGDTFEKGGVNLSHIKGNALPTSASENRQDLSGKPFEAMGVSLVIHPTNPFVPTSHANVRCLKVEDIIWFGGGYDLTPYYTNDTDCKQWHQAAKQVCDHYDPKLYTRFKQWCDDYFYLPHRKESRGIGGIFFDDFNAFKFERNCAFIIDVLKSYLQAYTNIVKKHYQHPFNAQQRQFQAVRRGRYAEFNLVYDRGTLFGLQSNGRTESILMSLPPTVEWHYNYRPKPNSEEEKLTHYFLQKKDWIDTATIA